VQKRRLVTLSPLDISHLMWAMARMELRDEAVLNRMSRVTVTKLADFTPQALSNVMW
jgi:hypothetical protein